ncbi:hypothetical protein H9P43_000403 [Blastocladiella emersonii ATCC 22665]|nr:hypothetical protein H9P43_000403 [Blastocladiella emersonii ATCC 22665]
MFAAPGATPGFSFNMPAATSAAAPAAPAPAAPAPAFGGGGMFGAPAASAPATSAAAPAPALAFGSFGAAAPAASAPTTSVAAGAGKPFAFGGGLTSTPATSAPATLGLGAAKPLTLGGFGAPATSAAAAPTFSLGGGFGAPAQQQQAQVQVTMKTKFADLPADVQNELRAIDKLIKEQTGLADSLVSKDTGSALRDLTDDIAKLRKTHGAIAVVLEKDLQAALALRGAARKELNRAETAGRILDAELHNTTAQMAHNKYYSTIAYFREKDDEFRCRATEYAQRIAELEDHIASLCSAHAPTPQTIGETVRTQHSSFLLLASQVAALHNNVEKLREQYVVYRRQYYGDAKNPFAVGGKKNRNKRPASHMAMDEDNLGVSYKDYANQFVEPTNFAPAVQPAGAPGAPATSAAAPAAATTASTFGSFGGFGAAKPFSTPAVTSTAPFGAPTLTLGATSAPATSAPATSLPAFSLGGFGQTSAPASSPAVGLAGTQAAAATPMLSFGATPASTAAAAPASGFSFGTTVSAAAPTMFTGFGKK